MPSVQAEQINSRRGNTPAEGNRRFETVSLGRKRGRTQCMKKQVTRIDVEDSASAGDYPNNYAPIPGNGQSCPHTGLKHAHLYKLLGNKGAAREFVRVVNLRDPKARHGKTLFHVGDMLRFLDGLALEQGTGGKRDCSPIAG
jgi:hypothetical protein